MLKKKLFSDTKEWFSKTLLRIIMKGEGITAMEFCSKGERLGSTPNIRKDGNLWPRSKIRLGSVMGNYIAGEEGFWLTQHA